MSELSIRYNRDISNFSGDSVYIAILFTSPITLMIFGGVILLDTTIQSNALNVAQIESFRCSFIKEPKYRMALNAVTKNSVNSIAMNRSAVVRANHTYSHFVKTGVTTNQNKSGRCWLFAGLNLFRMAAAEKMNIEEFELSQNYLMFWDKLEKSNYFLENILKTLNEPTDGRLISWLVTSPIEDGGQWDMFVNLVKKYGVVPKEVMPETESSGSSGQMNDRITNKLRENAVRLRQAHSIGVSAEDLKAERPRRLHAIDVDDLGARGHREVARFADLVDQAFQYGVPRSA